MPNETLDLIKSAENRAEEIKTEARENARRIVSKAQEDAETSIIEAEEDARKYKQQTLNEISIKASKLVDSEAEEAKYDASKITNHANRVRGKAVSYIVGNITGKND